MDVQKQQSINRSIENGTYHVGGDIECAKIKMSDLLPLLCETLRDRVLLETREELVRLRKMEAIAQSVEIVHVPSHNEEEDNDLGEGRVEVEDQPFTVIASGSIVKDGKYGRNDMYWQVSLTHINPCPLANLKDCRIQVGGGYDCVRLVSPDQENNLSVEVLPDPSDLDTRSSKFILFQTANVTKPSWIECVVHNWPTWRQERDSPYESGWDAITHGFDGTGGVEYLYDNVARQHPGVTIEFLSVSLARSEMHPAMQRLIPRAKLMEARKLRDCPPQQQSDPEQEELEVDNNPAIAFATGRYRRFAAPEQQADPSHLRVLLAILPTMEETARSIADPSFEEGFNVPAQIFVERVVLNYIDHSIEHFQSTILEQLMSDRVRYITELNEHVNGEHGDDDDDDEEENVAMADADDDED